MLAPITTGYLFPSGLLKIAYILMYSVSFTSQYSFPVFKSLEKGEKNIRQNIQIYISLKIQH